jgi:hypothetical protein
VGIVVSNALYLAAFWGEFRVLAARFAERAAKDDSASHPVPAWIVAVHLAFQSVTAPHQQRMDLQPPLLVGFFLAGLVVHGAGQTWWIAPVWGFSPPSCASSCRSLWEASHLDAMPLFVGATLLTAFNDNAAITYLASLVPGFSPALQYAVVAGAVTGGGLTVIANAPNPAGQAALARHFPQGVSPMRLLAGALIPTGVMAACFLLL